jgi:aminoglycoside phosphotransferase
MTTAPDGGPQVLAHGYTHRTTQQGAFVTKAYQGPDAEARCARETAVLSALAGLAPVPAIVATGPASLQTALMPGMHGQDLIAAGLAGPVLAACGRMLRQIHQLAIPPALAGGPAPPGSVVVHGDYGPNNVLLDAQARAVTAVLDWEWAHAGDAGEDLAWCEFIVRLHHPGETRALDGFYAAYGPRPAWADVHGAILSRCRSMLAFCERWRPGGSSARNWTERLDIAGSWIEIPQGTYLREHPPDSPK